MNTAKLFMILGVALMAVACTDPVQRNVESLNNLVGEVENNSANLTAEDWEAIEAEFERLSADIEANYDTMTPEQQQAAMQAIGRYYGELTKHGLNDLVKDAKKMFKSIPSFVEGFGDAFNEE